MSFDLALADDNSEIFARYKQEYCAVKTTAMPRVIFESCKNAESFPELKSAMDQYLKKCLDSASGSPLQVADCNDDVFYIDVTSKAFFKGAKIKSCKSSASSASTDSGNKSKSSP